MPSHTNLTVGSSFQCPHCGMTSEVKEEMVGDALFGTPEKKLVCAFCGAEVAGARKSPAKTTISKGSRDDALLDDLFGNSDRGEKGLSLVGGDDRFCRNCAHYLSSPFLSRCHLHHNDVEPMQMCDDFTPRGKEVSSDV